MNDQHSDRPHTAQHEAHRIVAEYRRRDGSQPDTESELLRRHPHLKQELSNLLRKLRVVETARQAAESLDDQEDQARPLDIEIPDYDLIHPIGEGGFGTVWLALNRYDHQFYALKIIHRDAEIEINGVREFKRIADANPYLVPIGHVGKSSDIYYYVMPLADDANGPSSLDYEPLTLQRYLERNGRLPVDEAVDITRDLLAGLEKLHAVGGIHHDVKPANIMRFEGKWKLSDSGLLSSDASPVGERGTPDYSPPEGNHDATADLFAVGKSLFQLVTGRTASEFAGFVADGSTIGGTSAEIEQLRRFVARACAADPSQRFSSAAEMLDALPVARASTKGVFQNNRVGRAMLLTFALASAIAFGFWGGTGSRDSSTAGPIVQFDVEILTAVHTDEGIQDRSEGHLGEFLFAVESGRSVIVKTEFALPRYAILFAMDAAGRTTPFMPAKLDEVPQLCRGRSLFPAASDDGQLRKYVFDESDEGLQVFVLLASMDPLPPLEELAVYQTIVEFEGFLLNHDEILRYREGRCQRLHRKTRSHIEPRDQTPAEVLRSFCAALETSDEIDEVVAVAFRVIDGKLESAKPVTENAEVT